MGVTTMTDLDDDLLFDDSLSVSWKTTKYWPAAQHLDRIITRDSRGVVMLWEYSSAEDEWTSMGELDEDGSPGPRYHVAGSNSQLSAMGMEEWAFLNTGFAGMSPEDVLKEFALPDEEDRYFTETEIAVGPDGTTVEATTTYVNGKPKDTRYVYKNPHADTKPTKKERVFEILNKIVGR